MKNFKYIVYSLLFVCFFSCDEEDLNKTLLISPSGDFSFTSAFISNYQLDINNVNDVIETLTWEAVSFGGNNVIVNYRVQGSVNQDFSTIDYESGNLTVLSLDLTVQNLLNLGEALGLDTDPQTTHPNGDPNNTGTIYFRIVSFVGNFNATNVAKQYSIIEGADIEFIEIQCEGSDLSQYGLVGPFNSWTITQLPVTALQTTNSPNVYRGVVSIDDQGFKVNLLDGSWGDGYAYGGSEGTLVADTGFDPVIPTTTGHYLFTVDLGGLTYSLEPTTAYGMIGPATSNGWDGPNHKFVPDECEPGVYVARNVPLIVGDFFIRANEDWTESYALGAGGEGTFQVNPGIGATGMPVAEDGNYDVLINFNDNTYELIKRN